MSPRGFTSETSRAANLRKRDKAKGAAILYVEALRYPKDSPEQQALSRAAARILAFEDPGVPHSGLEEASRWA